MTDQYWMEYLKSQPGGLPGKKDNRYEKWLEERITRLESSITTDSSAVIATLEARIALLEARIKGLRFTLELVASGELNYPEQTARLALQEDKPHE